MKSRYKCLDLNSLNNDLALLPSPPKKLLTDHSKKNQVGTLKNAQLYCDGP